MAGTTKRRLVRDGSHDFADSLPVIRLGPARLPRRFAPRNDKLGGHCFLTLARTSRRCSTGPGCPLPYKARPEACLLFILHFSVFRIHFSVFRIHSFPCPAPTVNTPARRKKSSDLSIGASCWRYLSFRAVTRKVLSAQMSLTSVFGMGTGVPSPQSTPTIWGHTLKTEQE